METDSDFVLPGQIRPGLLFKAAEAPVGPVSFRPCRCAENHGAQDQPVTRGLILDETSLEGLSSTGRPLRICSLEEHREGQNCIFIFLYLGFSFHALKLEGCSMTFLLGQYLMAYSIFWRMAAGLSCLLQSSTASTPGCIRNRWPNLLAFPAHPSNNSPRFSKNIVVRGTAISQITMFTFAGAIQDHISIN